jgi:hypothetical protein
LLKAEEKKRYNMAKTAQQMFDSLKEKIGDPLNIKEIGKPQWGSPYADCEASFFVRMHINTGVDRHVHTSSIEKANKIVELLNNWVNSKK